MALEMIGITNSGQHQDLRRVDGAAAQDDFGVGGATLNDATIVDELHADGSNAVEKNSGHQNVGFDFYVRPELKVISLNPISRLT